MSLELGRGDRAGSLVVVGLECSVGSTSEERGAMTSPKATNGQDEARRCAGLESVHNVLLAAGTLHGSQSANMHSGFQRL